MPEISRFLGIVVYMLYDDHRPPHFHAEYGEYKVTVEINTGVVQGRFPRRALKSLILPIKEIAMAIETRDSGKLSTLPGVGGRLAEKIIAELHGKTAKFALSKAEEPLAKDRTHAPKSFDVDAMEVLLQLQYNRAEAQRMIDSAVKANPEINSAEDLISFIFKNEMKAMPLKKRA